MNIFSVSPTRQRSTWARVRNFLCWWFATSANLFFKHSQIFLNKWKRFSPFEFDFLFRTNWSSRSSQKLLIHDLIWISRLLSVLRLQLHFRRLFLHNAFLLWFSFFAFVAWHTEKMFRKENSTVWALKLLKTIKQIHERLKTSMLTQQGTLTDWETFTIVSNLFLRLCFSRCSLIF